MITDSASTEVKIMRGLFYVHLYSSLEKTINEIVENTLGHIRAKSIQMKHFIPPFNSIALVDNLRSFKDAGHSSFFKKAHELFVESASNTVCSISESVLNKSLQNIWADTVVETCRSFGIENISMTPRVKATIDEIVDKRNAVAHGRESAFVIGERHRSNILREKMEILINFCLYIIDIFEEYVTSKRYLKPNVRRRYA